MDHLADAPIANILIIAGVIFLAVGLFGRVGGFIGSIFGNIEAGNSSRVLAGLLGVFLIVGGGWLHQVGDKAAAKNPSTTTPSATGVAAPASAVPNPTAGGAPPAPAPSALPDPAPVKVAGSRAAKTSSLDPQRTPGSRSAATDASALAAAPASIRENLPTAATPASVDQRIIGTWTNVIPPQQNGTIARMQIAHAASGLDAHIWAKCKSGECDAGIHHLTITGNTCKFDVVSGNRRIVGSMNVYAPNVLLLSGDAYELGTSNHWHHNRVLTNSNLSGKLQVAFSVYLDAPGQKAFAMTPAGAWASYRKQSTPEEATHGALQYCEDHGWRDCRVILVNDEGPQQ